jgi:hypothetical protein
MQMQIDPPPLHGLAVASFTHVVLLFSLSRLRCNAPHS